MSEPIRVFVCGEGWNELGSRSGHRVYQDNREPGVIEALLRRARESGWEIVGALNWKDIPKLRARGRSPDEADYVARLTLDADEHRAEVLAYVRDGDDEAEGRRAAHARGKEVARVAAPNVRIVGEVAVPTIEGWILAMLGEHGTEAMTSTKAMRLLEEAGKGRKDTAAMVRIVGECPALESVPADAVGLRSWHSAAKVALAEQAPTEVLSNH